MQESVQQKAKVLIVGLDDAGKTSLLYRLRMGEVIATIPTVGFNVEEITLKKGSKKVEMWDVGGKDSLRGLWKHYFEKLKALIFVVAVD